LLDLADPPVTLWVAGGHAALAHAPRVAVVGTRAHTALGERTTAAWSPSSRSAARPW
jgi:predicted Rossmann fold nucleotide-binding protein DprA/Smf involved in DNA uptake